jgi:MoaA/NifB/PqqE/SkfB family radical SAM enzyme
MCQNKTSRIKMKTGLLAPKILSAYVKFKAKKSVPLFASYNVTGRCNMRCVFCNWWKNEIPELSTRGALEAIDAVCNLGVPFFDLSGGEPLLRKDLVILAKRIADHGCLVSMIWLLYLLMDQKSFMIK